MAWSVNRDGVLIWRSCFPVAQIFLCLLAIISLKVHSTSFDERRADFTLFINERVVSFDTTFQMVLPNQEVRITFANAKDNGAFKLAGRGISALSDKGAITFRAPNNIGHYPLNIIDQQSGSNVRFQLFVITPASEVKNGVLNGYRIGEYPPPLRGLDSYQPPPGYIGVSKETESIQISPHFTLGQFLCKQKSDYPKYIVLRPRLLEKLELFLSEVNEKKIPTDSFVIMSGYRTPFYNKSIGNVPSSRHVYGGAADIYIDVDPPAMYMDDINKDGKADFDDAVYLYNLAEGLPNRHKRNDLIGGLGKYKSKPWRGPFIHVDVRGSRARWTN